MLYGKKLCIIVFLSYGLCIQPLGALPGDVIATLTSQKPDYSSTQTNSVPATNFPSMALESISAERVERARATYVREATQAPYVRIATGLGTATAAAVIAYNGYMAYKYLLSQNFVERVENCEKMTLLLHSRIDALAKKELVPEQKPSWTDALKGSAWGLGSFIAYQGLMALGYNLIISPVIESLLHAKDLLPTQGGLTWYIMHRTSYNHHGEVLLNYVRSNFAPVNTAIRNSIAIKPASLTKRFQGTLQLFIYDLEKIIGYLQYFKTTINNQQPAAQALIDCCEGFCGTLEDTVAALIASAQQGCPTQTMSEYIVALTGTVIDAQKFVTTHYN